MRTIAIAMAVTAVVAACGRGDDKPANARPEMVDKTITTNFRLEVTGDDSARLEGKRDVRVVTRKGPGESLPFSVASVTLPEPAPLPDGRVVSPEFSVTGLYVKDDTYTVPAGLGTAPPTGTTVAANIEGTVKISVVHVTILPHAGAQTEARYSYLAEPCTVTFDDDGLKGRASCPALVAHDGKRVSMQMTWGG